MYGNILCPDEAQNNKKSSACYCDSHVGVTVSYSVKTSFILCVLSKKVKSYCPVLFSCCRLYSPVSEQTVRQNPFALLPLLCPDLSFLPLVTHKYL